jgi:hypothetical protein
MGKQVRFTTSKIVQALSSMLHRMCLLNNEHVRKIIKDHGDMFSRVERSGTVDISSK